MFSQCLNPKSVALSFLMMPSAISPPRVINPYCWSQNLCSGKELQAVELVAFSTAILSAVAAGIHLISVQIVMTDGHVPACAAGDRPCAEGYNMVIVMWASQSLFSQLSYWSVKVSLRQDGRESVPRHHDWGCQLSTTAETYMIACLRTARAAVSLVPK